MTISDDFQMKNFADIKIDNFVNEFALYLYQNNYLDSQWKIKKTILRSEFLKFCENKKIKYDRYLDKKIGTILREKNFLRNTAKDSDLFCLSFRSIYQYENDTLKKLDDQLICEMENKSLLQQITDQNSDDFEIENNASQENLVFENCVKVCKKIDFIPQVFSCYICQISFDKPDQFEEHVHIHNDISDFEWLKLNSSSLPSSFEFYYQKCQNPFYIRLTLKTDNKKIIIERIIAITSNSIKTLHKHHDFETNPQDEVCSFNVDRHVFNSDSEQPVVVLYRFRDIHYIFIEHFFMRLRDIPSFSSNKLRTYASKRVPTRPELKKISNLKSYYPDKNLIQMSKKKDFETHLLSNKILSEHIKNGLELGIENADGILKFLLELEDVATENLHLKLTQYKAKIKGFQQEYSVKLNFQFREFSSNSLEDILKPGDDVIIKESENSSKSELDIKTKPYRNSTKKKKFVGVVNQVYGKTVCFRIKICKSKKPDVNQTYTVEFRPNRLNFKYQYLAIEKLKENFLLRKFLFPCSPILDESNVKNIRLSIVNPSVENNPEQKQAVINIVNGFYKVPYIIFGPPGTGKTTTIVESVIQIKLSINKAKILITTGSNAACDEVAKRILHLTEKEPQINHIKVLRIYSKTAEKKSDDIEEIIIESSNLAHGFHFYPGLETIAYYDVVICTLSVVGRLTASGMSPYFFSHCFIDECAASTEAEALIPISATFHPKINIIIAGDPKQLGPILKSDSASKFGLKYSLMERLLERDCYKVNSDRKYDKRIQTRLIRNFRTHPDILTMSNRLFYANDLLPCASKDITDWATNWYCLPEKEVPIILDCVEGHTKKDRNSTSFYNIREVNAVMEYVKKIMFFKINGREIKEEDIGVISPYKKQNIMIKEELNKRNWYNIATGAVETFQGQEKPIIIISTVRSSRSDRRGTGFLKNEKRLNVMLTRAQALLIIVGDPKLLNQMPYWKDCVEYFDLKKALKTHFKQQENEKYSTKMNQNVNEKIKFVNNVSRSFQDLRSINKRMFELNI